MFVAAIVACPSCDKKDPDQKAGLESVTYEFNEELFPNPERGMYSGSGFSKETDAPLAVSRLSAARMQNRTLYMCEFWLKDFFESDISEAYLQLIRKSLEAYREGGMKCILRFGYSDGIADLSNPQKSGPFDATEEQVLRHIAQLKPILQEYYDVIYVVQTGFIGCWGEWYYTTSFKQNPSSEADFQPRKHVCDALLDALPATRQIELRIPRYKMKMYGYTLADTITVAEAHTATTKARIGGHNDCWLADASDQGTFSGAKERSYWEAESKYTIMGGETCAKSSYCACDKALPSFEAQHFSYLNMSYNKQVLNVWKENNCYDEIVARLGYRLFLTKCAYTPEPASGSPFRLVLRICNDGFASLMNPRDAEIVLRDKAGSIIKTYNLESDPRFWMAGTTTEIDQTINLPDGLSGEYTISLNLPDPCETLRNNPMFSVRLANKDVWDEKAGMNILRTINL